MVKNPLAKGGDRRDAGSIPGSGRSPRERNGNPLQYSRLETPMDRGAWRAVAHGVAKSWTRLKRLSSYTQRDTHTTFRKGTGTQKVLRQREVCIIKIFQNFTRHNFTQV